MVTADGTIHLLCRYLPSQCSNVKGFVRQGKENHPFWRKPPSLPQSWKFPSCIGSIRGYYQGTGIRDHLPGILKCVVPDGDQSHHNELVFDLKRRFFPNQCKHSTFLQQKFQLFSNKTHKVLCFLR